MVCMHVSITRMHAHTCVRGYGYVIVGEGICVCAHVCLHMSGHPHVHLEATGEGISFESRQVGMWVRGSP